MSFVSAALKLVLIGQLHLVHGALLRSGSHQAPPAVDYQHPAWLHSCRAIYLDVGSNIGVQVRKLYEGHKYPGATVLPLFDKHFGAAAARSQPSSTTGICALGFEPNPKHLPRLQQIEAAYAQRGWNAHFYPFAAWKEEGTMEFNVVEAPNHNDWGAHLRHMVLKNSTEVEKKKKNVSLSQFIVKARTVDLSHFVQTLPAGTAYLMKMDIEGSEYGTLAKMINQKELCQNVIHEAFIETHTWGDASDWGGVRSYASIQQRINGQTDCPTGVTLVTNTMDEDYTNDVDNNFSG